MILCHQYRHRRSGTAAVQLAVCGTFLCTLMVGIWEVGRMVQVQNLMANAAREGGRQAAAGQNTNATICQNVANYLTTNGLNVVWNLGVTGNTTNNSAKVTGLSSTSSLSAGMTISGTGIPSGTTIQSVDSATQITLSQKATASGSSVSMSASNVTITLVNKSSASRSNPQTANQLDQFCTTVTVPYSVMRWSTVAQITPTSSLTVSTYWNSLLDNPVTTLPAIPGN